MSALSGYVALAAVLVVAAIAAVVRGRRRRPSHGGVSQAESAQGQGDDTAATGYVPGVWMLGGAESAAPGHGAHGPHHGVDAGGSHAADAGSGHSDGGDSGGAGH